MSLAKRFRAGRSVLLVVPALSCLIASPLAAQQSSQSGTTSPATSSSSAASRLGRRPPSVPRSRHVSGRVVLSNGEIPPAGTAVEVSCGRGDVSMEAFTDSRGEFVISIRSDDDRLNAPSQSRMRRAQVVACQLRASLGGHRSSRATVSTNSSSSFSGRGVVVLVLHPLEDDHGSVVSLTTLQAPKKATRKFESAQKELNKKKPNLSKAADRLEEAIEIFPDFAAAWALLGETLLKSNDMLAAKDALQQAIEADPQYLPPYAHLASIYGRESAWESLASLCEDWLKRKQTTLGRYYLALASVELRRMDEALEALRLVVESPDVEQFPQAHHLLGMIYAQRGDIENAAEQYAKFLALAPESRMAASVRSQLEQWGVEDTLASRQTASPEQPFAGATPEHRFFLTEPPE